jgi:RimJ/RimL family protein N-acetyltransferase
VNFDLQPHLVGELLELRPLRPDDWPALFQAASDPLIWEVHPQRDRYQAEVFREFFDGALACGGAFAVLDRATGKVIGSTRYHSLDPERSEVEIGFTFLARRYWGGVYNGEMKRLLLDHAFRFLENVVFSAGVENFRSQRALEKIGAQRVGGVTKMLRGQPIEHVLFRIQRSDWQAAAAANQAARN